MFFKKYVDDLITLIPIESVDEVLQKLNGYNSRIQFTVEKEACNQISFLDMYLIRDPINANIVTNWYCKPYASNRIINFNSHHHFGYKKSTAYNLIHRILELSDTQFYSNNIETVKRILSNNGYPSSLVKHLIIKYNRKKKLNIPDIKVTNTNARYRSITFVNGLSQQVTKIISAVLPDVVVAHKNRKTIRDIFTRIKDNTEKQLKSNLCYKIKCKNCPAVYIGQTSRHLKTRLSEHRRDTSPKKSSNRKLDLPSARTSPNKTALKSHAESNNHAFDFDKFSIIGRETVIEKRLTMEACNILIEPDACNHRTDTEGLIATYTSVLKNYFN